MEYRAAGALLSRLNSRWEKVSTSIRYCTIRMNTQIPEVFPAPRSRMLHSKTSSEFGMSRCLLYPSSVFFATELSKMDALFPLPSCVHIRWGGIVRLIVSPDLSLNKEVAVDFGISVSVHSSVDMCSFIRDKPFIAPSTSFLLVWISFIASTGCCTNT